MRSKIEKIVRSHAQFVYATKEVIDAEVDRRLASMQPTFYCPYVPLTTPGIVTDTNSVEMVTSFYSRYGYVEFVNTTSAPSTGDTFTGSEGAADETVESSDPVLVDETPEETVAGPN